MSNRPLIGITALATRFGEPPHTPIYALAQRYIHAIEEAGGAPIILPPRLDDASLAAIFPRLDGVLLSGGGDVDPACYGEAPHPSLTDLNVERDRVEFFLTRQAVEQDKPILAICRGIQVFNVALGGSLVQDIPTQVAGALIHMPDRKKLPRDYIAHPVRVEPGTRLRQVIGVDEAETNSWHHQSIKRAAPGVRVVASSPDGIVEAVEVPDRGFAIGVQWHPEWLYDRQPEMMNLFKGLVEAAQRTYR